MSNPPKSSSRSGGQAPPKVSFVPRDDVAQLMSLAVDLLQKGELVRSKTIFEQVLEQQPEHAEALHLLGIACHQSGESDRGVELVRRAVESKPGDSNFHNNLGNMLESRGELQAALDAYHAARELNTGDPYICFNLGNVLHKLDRLEESQSSYRMALGLESNDAEFHYNLGNVLKQQGKLAEAVESYEHALRLSPTAGAYNNLGNAMHDLGRHAEAIRCYEKSLELAPKDPHTLNNIGNTLKEQGNNAGAVEHYRRALAADPGFAAVYKNLAGALTDLGDIEAAIEAARSALRCRPPPPDARETLAAVLRLLISGSYRPEVETELRVCLDSPEVDSQSLAYVCASQIRAKHRTQQRLADEAARAALIDDLAADPWCLEILSSTFNVDPEFERTLTAIRRLLLVEHAGGTMALGARLGLVVAMGLQCHANDYTFEVSDEESAALESLSASGKASPTDLPERAPWLGHDLPLLAMYGPLAALPCAESLRDVPPSEWEPLLIPLVERTLNAPFEEQAIRSEIASIGTIHDGISRAVQAQYEESPYPRWLSLAKTKSARLRDRLAKRFPHASLPALRAEPLRVLVAGCGTGREPIRSALDHQGSDVFGVDLSRASLAYAIRMARQLGVENVRFAQADILGLSELEERFHVIECAGTLHHMADPIAAWRSLTDLLEPGGLMKVGLYSEKGRVAVAAAHEEIKRMGLAPTPEDIRSFRARVLNGDFEGAIAELVNSEDFYTLNTCRDLLFHVHEQCFNLTQISEALDTLGLTFIGFQIKNRDTIPRYRQEVPGDPAMTDLAAWEAFETRHPDAFSGLYQLWCFKPDVVDSPSGHMRGMWES